MVKTLNIKHSTLNKRLFVEAKRYIPGGVNSPVRSFKAVESYPVFIREASGCKLYSEEGREFIDYCMSFGALILGHSHPAVAGEIKRAIDRGASFGANTKLETELARLIIKAIPSIEKIRLTNSGTEAVMTAIRLARAYTRKDKIIKFEGSYHGHTDYLLDASGIPKDFTKHTLVCPYNDIEKVKALAERRKKDIAAIIVEPVAGNMGVVLPQMSFLQELRRLTEKHGIVLIFDEVITGFRLVYGGAQNLFEVKPDLTCLGKIIGGGLPIGAVGGRGEIMELLAPQGTVYQAGTFSGNPISVSAGISTLKLLAEFNTYKILEERTRYLCENIVRQAEACNIKVKINFVGSMFSLFFANRQVMDYNSIIKFQNTDLFKRFYKGILNEGVYFSPSPFEANFVSAAHSLEDINKTLKVIETVFHCVGGKG